MSARPQAAVRLLDANANRALEGLRVCEDAIRFGLDDPTVLRRLRALRHAVAAALRALPVTPAELARSRNSRRDPGRAFASDPIPSLERMLVINLQRAKEALRVLEETCRLIAPAHAPTFQRLRFRAYDVERHLLLALAPVRHPRPRRRRRT
ncbi:MAG: hypothetical protein HYY15_02600 [Candidatus Omnitrophica bacterium]|nr:hypothetical protein [Candidatus Omnitrophota bacterium]